MTNEAFARAKIDDLLKDVGWSITDGISVRFEYPIDGTMRADYVLNDRHGRPLAVIEAKKASINPAQAADQALAYAKALNIPLIFLTNGEEIRFWDYKNEAHPRVVKTFFSQPDLERQSAAKTLKVDPLTIPIDTKIASRDYQHECIDAVCKEISVGRRKMLIEMATGTGKTRTAGALIKRLLQSNQATRILFLVDRITLAKQTEDVFAEVLRDYPAYVLRAGRVIEDQKVITISTLQTMINEYHKFSSGYFDLVISDECHRSIYGQWSGVLKHFDGIQIGLTATPCVAGDEVETDDDKFVRDTLRFFEVTEPTYKYQMKQAIDEGYLVPYHIYKAKTVKTASEEGFPVKREELDWSAMDAETAATFEELFEGQKEIIVDPSALERKFTIPERNRSMVREFRRVLEEGFTSKDGVKRYPLDGKTIVFAVNKRHAETLAQMFDQEFADKKPSPDVRYADFVVSDSGADDTVDAYTKIKRFKDEEFPKILVSVNMLDTGFDCPEVVNLVMARFTKSAILYQQMRGRGTRKADHIHKSLFTIFDFVGVTDYHKDDEGKIEGGYVVISKPPEKPQGKTRKLLVLDVNDYIDPSSREWVTLDDQGNYIFTTEQQVRANKLGLKFEAWISVNKFNSDQLRLLKMMAEQIKANVETITEWDEYLFVNPPFSSMGGIQRAIQTFGGKAGLDAMIRSLNKTLFDNIDTAYADNQALIN